MHRDLKFNFHFEIVDRYAVAGAQVGDEAKSIQQAVISSLHVFAFEAYSCIIVPKAVPGVRKSACRG